MNKQKMHSQMPVQRVAANPLKLMPEETALVVVDVQERLAAAMPEEDLALCNANIERLIEACNTLSMPVIVTEQYPEGLGPTLPGLRTRLASMGDGATTVSKLDFDATGEPTFNEGLERLSRDEGEDIRTLLVCGMEAHICVFQTARGLVGSGFAVQVPVDATCARVRANRDVATGLWSACGALVTSTEAALFDLVGRAGTPEFKAISKLVR